MEVNHNTKLKGKKRAEKCSRKNINSGPINTLKLSVKINQLIFLTKRFLKLQKY